MRAHDDAKQLYFSYRPPRSAISQPPQARMRTTARSVRLLCSAASAAASRASSSRVSLEAASAVLPHPDKVRTGGEDAQFVLHERRAFGVFDGVGGWASKGVDAGEFSRELAKRTSNELAKTEGDLSTGELNAALAKGLEGVFCLGSCTACLLRIGDDGGLSALNVGDSGFRIFRPPRRPAGPLALALTRASASQQHYFNCPFQLGSGSGDSPSDGDTYVDTVAAGDIVVMATDGVLDNLFDEELAAVLAYGLAQPHPASSAEALAADIARIARELSFRTGGRSPFSVAAEEEGMDVPGGKVDDVTVICIKVLCAGDAAADDGPRSKL